MAQKWSSTRRVIPVFLLITTISVMRGWQAPQAQVDPRLNPTVNIYQDNSGFVYANPYTVHVYGHGQSKITFHSDTVDFVVAFDDGRVCGQRVLSGARGTDVVCQVPRGCVRGGRGAERDACGYHFYTVRAQGAARRTEFDPEVVIDEGMGGGMVP